MLRLRDVAEDAVKTRWCGHSIAGGLPRAGQVCGWLFLILRNRCYAERGAAATGAALDSTDELFARPWPDGEYEQGGARPRVEQALQHLTPEQREVFVLSIRKVAYEEIAGVTAQVASLKMRMHRAYDRLRELMKEASMKTGYHVW